ncbi:MAG: efflux RND transporter periplasmic adaptor subunit [Gemmataceae bacterium]
MSIRRAFPWLAAAAVVSGVGYAGWRTQDTWRPWLDSLRAGQASAAAEEGNHEHAHGDRIKLTDQARKNLGLSVGPATVTPVYWRTAQIPGVIVDRPGQSDRGVTAPVTGVVAKIHSYPSDTVRPGDPLFELRITSEFVQNTQAELYKAAKEVQLQEKVVEKMRGASDALPEARIVEARNQLTKLATQVLSYRQILQSLGLTSAQVDLAAAGKFVKEVTVVAPPPAAGDKPLVPAPPVASSASNMAEATAYEVQELKAQLGEQVQAGQVLGMLANHRLLYVEGRAFKGESALLARSAEGGWPVEAEFAEDDAKAWPELKQTLTIRHLANSMDPASRTFAFFVPLTNQARSYQKDGKTFLLWRFRPGQRVRLHVRAEPFENVIVLPSAAVVREGPDSFVFRANGDAFDRKPVHVLYEDRRSVVIANDGSVAPGLFVARNAAAALNRAVNAQKSGGGHDEHAGHSH